MEKRAPRWRRVQGFLFSSHFSLLFVYGNVFFQERLEKELKYERKLAKSSKGSVGVVTLTLVKGGISICFSFWTKVSWQLRSWICVRCAWRPFLVRSLADGTPLLAWERLCDLLSARLMTGTRLCWSLQVVLREETQTLF
jgi:hypothetical protein